LGSQSWELEGGQTLGEVISQSIIGANLLHLNLITQVHSEEVILDYNVLGPE